MIELTIQTSFLNHPSRIFKKIVKILNCSQHISNTSLKLLI